MNSKIRVDVWDRYRVVYLRDGDIWSSGSVRGQVDDYLNSHINYTGESRLVTRYTFEVIQEPTVTVKLVGEKYRPYRNPMLAWGEEYSFSPLEFANTPHYLERLTSSVAYDSGARFMDIWVAYFTNNRYFANRNKFVYVDKYNPNFVVLNQLNMMSTCIPWKEVEVVRV